MGRKTLWGKEKLMVSSNFSFSHSVFKWRVLHTRKNQGLFGKVLNILFVTELHYFELLQAERITESPRNAAWMIESILHPLPHSPDF